MNHNNFNRVMGQYSEFRKECRISISSRLRSGNYTNIRGSNTKGSIKGNDDVPISGYKTRVNIIGRPAKMKHIGIRDTNVGHLETLVVVQAPFNDPADYTKGIDTSKVKRGLRIVIGNSLSNFSYIVEKVRKDIKKYYPSISNNLYKGNYAGFVKRILDIMDGSINDFKKKYVLIPKK